MKSTMVTVLATLVFSTGCADVSSVPWREDSADPAAAGLTYSLPRGLVPVRVFADANGIGLSVEPAYNIADPNAGFLIAQLKPSVLNRETMSLGVDDDGLLSLVSSDSQAKILEIAAEAAKFAGRLTFQSGKATALATSVTVLQRDLDPLSARSVMDINDGIAAGIQRAAGAFRIANTKGRMGVAPFVALSVDPPPVAEPVIDFGKCKVGICVRVLTARTITVSVDGVAVASKVVNVPSWQVVPIAIPQSVLSDQKITVSVKDGMLTKYDLVRDAEALGLVKIPGAILGGVIAGVTQGLTDSKGTIDARKSLLDSEEAFAIAQEAARDRAQARVTGGRVNQSATPAGGAKGGAAPSGAGGVATPDEPPPKKGTTDTGAGAGDSRAAYRNATLTIYPYSSALADAIRNLPK